MTISKGLIELDQNKKPTGVSFLSQSEAAKYYRCTINKIKHMCAHGHMMSGYNIYLQYIDESKTDDQLKECIDHINKVIEITEDIYKRVNSVNANSVLKLAQRMLNVINKKYMDGSEIIEDTRWRSIMKPVIEYDENEKPTGREFESVSEAGLHYRKSSHVLKRHIVEHTLMEDFKVFIKYKVKDE